MENAITVQAVVEADILQVWKYWVTPKHICKWNAASEDWQTTKAEVDLKVGGRFTSRMEAKDGSMGFDFGGTYTQVDPPHTLAYTLDDNRKVMVTFAVNADEDTLVVETFEPESENTPELQKNGWQAILNEFKEYVEYQEA